MKKCLGGRGAGFGAEIGRIAEPIGSFQPFQLVPIIPLTFRTVDPSWNVPLITNQVDLLPERV
jgi:hypothetical protein